LDTFGYAFLEAMAYGIPCVGASHFAVPEIIENNVSGYLVNPPVRFFDSRGVGHPEHSIESIDGTATAIELSVCLEKLLDSRTLRERMGLLGKNAVTSGKFSIAKRNAQLKEIYESSIARRTT
jgi:glycosyltransferase involved in cell wall biosynthesis